jgi:hypothetical protein
MAASSADIFTVLFTVSSSFFASRLFAGLDGDNF